MAQDILKLVSLKTLFSSYSDDIIDRLNHKYTTAILLIFTTVVMGSQFVKDPIVCWTPAEFTGSYVKYTDNYCWIKNTYFVPMDDTIPVDINTRRTAELTYYQWVPLILLFMAFMFKCPNLLWKIVSSHTGFSFKDAAELTSKALTKDDKDYKATVSKLVRLMDTWLRSQRQYKHNFLVRARSKVSRFVLIYCSKREGKFLSALYFNVKVLYVANVIGQFFLLNAFLGMDFNTLGYKVLDGLANDEMWPESPRFPRITLCDFRIRQLQNVQRFTVQCVLPFNLFNEKIFIFLWFWLFFLAVASCTNLVKWFILFMVKRNNYRLVKKYLKITSNMKDAADKTAAHRFVDTYLRDDGCFVLRILAKNTSELVVIDLVEELWKRYKKNPMVERAPKDESDEEEYQTKDFGKAEREMTDNGEKRMLTSEKFGQIIYPNQHMTPRAKTNVQWKMEPIPEDDEQRTTSMQFIDHEENA